MTTKLHPDERKAYVDRINDLLDHLSIEDQLEIVDLVYEGFIKSSMEDENNCLKDHMPTWEY